jgi:hypothetical protein
MEVESEVASGCDAASSLVRKPESPDIDPSLLESQHSSLKHI